MLVTRYNLGINKQMNQMLGISHPMVDQSAWATGDDKPNNFYFDGSADTFMLHAFTTKARI